jgi:RimJ/RimL family protein N-acetyltransferase
MQRDEHAPEETGAGAFARLAAGEDHYIAGRIVRLRLIRESDAGLWTDFVNGCSSQSLWFRFLAPFSATPERARRFCALDPDEELAVVAETVADKRRLFVGIGRLVRVPGQDYAEYAVIVSDAWQRKTLGRLLTQRCVELARHWGMKAVHSETARENFSITRVLRRCDFHFDGRDDNMLLMSRELG